MANMDHIIIIERIRKLTREYGRQMDDKDYKGARETIEIMNRLRWWLGEMSISQFTGQYAALGRAIAELSRPIQEMKIQFINLKNAHNGKIQSYHHGGRTPFYGSRTKWPKRRG